MPKGFYEHKARTKKEDIRKFLMFCYENAEIKKMIETKDDGVKIACEIYKQQTGIDIKPTTAKNNLDRAQPVEFNGKLAFISF